MKMAVFWVVALSRLLLSLVEVYWLIARMMEAASTSNIGKLLPDYTVQQPRRQTSLYQHQTTVQRYYIKAANKLFENVAKFKHLRTT
jgi:hypothetical protein